LFQPPSSDQKKGSEGEGNQNFTIEIRFKGGKPLSFKLFEIGLHGVEGFVIAKGKGSVKELFNS